MELLERVQGVLVGLACGNAVGVTLEFKKPGSFAPIREMLGGGTFGVQPGQWTDDTAQALCVAKSLVEKRQFDPVDQMGRLVNWWQCGNDSCTGKCYDIGGTTSKSLAEFVKTGNPFCGTIRKNAAGNGSLIRIAPLVAFFFAHEGAERAIEVAAENSRMTHCSPLCVDACRYFAAVLCGALAGRSKEEILSPLWSPVPGLWGKSPLCEEIRVVASGAYKQKQATEIAGKGFVVDSLESALWSFYRSNSFEEGVLQAVNLGEDACSTGALVGQLTGALYGLQGIPESWRTRLAQRDLLLKIAVELL